MLGLVDFAELQVLQRRIVYDLGEQGAPRSILCEHPPTISIGRSGSRAHIAADDEMLQGMGIRTFYVNRGGGCVLHLPRPARGLSPASRSKSSASRCRPISIDSMPRS